jgi:hypothetical protein
MSTTPSLPADLTVASLTALRADWLARLPAAPGVAGEATASPLTWPVAAGAVDEVDAAGVQFLLALSHALAARRHALRLVDPSPRLADACRALGLGALLADAQATTEHAA